MSRLSGVGRIGAGSAVLAASASESPTIIAPLAASVYAGDQFSTALKEIWYGKYQQSHGTQLLKSMLGDGALGTATGLAYDVVPGGIASVSRPIPLPPGSQYLKLSSDANAQSVRFL